VTTIADLERAVSATEAVHKLKKERVDQLSALVEDLKLDVEELAKTEQTLLFISTKILGQSITNVDTLVTQGLRLVFDDQQLTFSTKTEKYRGKTSVKFELTDNGVVAPLTESYGGGVLVIVGLLLRVVTIVTLKMRRVILIDESLSHLSESYIPNASKLIKRFCSKLGFEIIMVTHQEEFAAHADTRYKAGRRGLLTIYTKA